MATYYVDPVSGNDGNAGTSFGAAKLTIAGALAVPVAAGDTIRLCATGSHVLTSTVSLTVAGTPGLPITITGANSSGTVDGTKATVTSSTNSVALFTIGNITGYITFRHLTLTHTAGTRGRGIFKANDGGTPVQIAVQNCVIDGCSNGIEADVSVSNYIQGLTVDDCEIKNCTGHGIVSTGGAIVTDSIIHDNTTDGLRNGSGSGGTMCRFTLNRTKLYANGGKGLNVGTSSTANGDQRISLTNCVVSGNTSDGIFSAQTTGTVGYSLVLENNIIQGNGGYGVNVTSAPSVLVNRNNAYRANTSGNLNGLSAGTGDVTLTGDPFTNAAAGDFSLNATAGAGAACAGAGYQRA